MLLNKIVEFSGFCHSQEHLFNHFFLPRFSLHLVFVHGLYSPPFRALLFRAWSMNVCKSASWILTSPLLPILKALIFPSLTHCRSVRGLILSTSAASFRSYMRPTMVQVSSFAGIMVSDLTITHYPR